MMALPDGLPSVEAIVAGPSCFAMLAALFGMVEKAAKATLVDDLQLARSVRSHIADPDLESASICRAFIHDARQQVLDRASLAKPQRFVRAAPRPPAKPVAAWINPPPKTEAGQA